MQRPASSWRRRVRVVVGGDVPRRGGVPAVSCIHRAPYSSEHHRFSGFLFNSERMNVKW